jgi:hypothetical protein
MNPLTEGIVASLIANGLTEIICHLTPATGFQIRQEQAIAEILKKDQALTDILQKAVSKVAKSIHFRDEGQTEKLKLFFVSPEAEAIVRQIYGIYFAPEMRLKSESAIREEFAASLSFFLRTEDVAVRGIADSLFESLVQGCERALSGAVDKGLLSAHEAKSTSRHRLILDELATIRKNLDLLEKPQRPTLNEILQFEEDYRKQLVNRHGHITPPHFDVARKIPIKDICVSPKFVRPPGPREHRADPIGFEHFLSGLYRAVVLGNPGGGKSTLASKICYDLASEYRKRHVNGRELTAVLVVLRDYGAAKKEHTCSIVQFMEAVANSHYQIKPPSGSIEYMLLNGRAIVIFDGLDELLDTSHRLEISDDIESFCNLYPAVPILVTSREVGYEQAPLDSNRFIVYRLAPFDDQQVGEYVHKWFAVDLDLTVPQQQQKVRSFLEESLVVTDIRSNPLMLALMCNIYRGENYIPRNRPDVYEKCATMLFERWDKSRGIFIPLPFEAHISPAMKYLAHWIYSDDKLQAGVTEQSLVSKATDYLCPRRFEDKDEAEKAARDFIEFCRGRAWVFTDTGTTKVGDRLYQFTHRTFLEYFTAAHLVRTNPTPERLLPVLFNRIAKREWDVVSQLAFQLQNKQVEGAGDVLLTALLEKARTVQAKKEWNILSFAARSLEFLVPSPKTTRGISTACLKFLFTIAEERDTNGPPPKSLHAGSDPSELLGDLLSSTEENRGPIADSIEKEVTRLIISGTELQSRRAVELAFTLGSAVHRGHGQSDSPAATRQFWSALSERLVDSCMPRVLELSKNDTCMCIRAYLHQKVSLQSSSIGMVPPPFFDPAHFGPIAMHTPCLRQM